MRILQIIAILIAFNLSCSTAKIAPEYKEKGPITTKKIITSPKRRIIITITKKNGKCIISKKIITEKGEK